MRRLFFSAFVFLTSLSLVACSFVNDQPDPSGDEDQTSGPYEQTGLALTADVLADTDIKKMTFTVQQVGCNSGATKGSPQSKTIDYEDMQIPGGLETFADKPYDKDSEHIFADSYFLVDAGCYNVVTQPLRKRGKKSKDCESAHKDGIRVRDGKTTEILLVNQCRGDKRGGLDVAGTINHAPEIDDLVFEDSKFVQSCQPLTKVCVTASDPDNDPLEFEWSPAEAKLRGSIQQVGSPTQDAQTGKWESCAEVATTRTGEYGFEVEVFDKDGNGDRIESVLETQNPQDAHESRDSLQFPMYGMASCRGRNATILMAMNNDPGLNNAGYASKLVKQTADWVSPRFDSKTGKALVVMDDNNNNEHPGDDDFIVGQMNGTFGSVNLMAEPSGGLSSSDVKGYDIVWFVNPGYPMDDTDSFDVVQDFLQDGGGVVFSGDDMAGPALSGGRDFSFFTKLNYQDNGAQTCGATTNNNSGNNYEVTFANGTHPILEGIRNQKFSYGNDIDHTTRMNVGENILATASFSSGQCTERFPAITSVDPIDLP